MDGKNSTQWIFMIAVDYRRHKKHTPDCWRSITQVAERRSSPDVTQNSTVDTMLLAKI